MGVVGGPPVAGGVTGATGPLGDNGGRESGGGIGVPEPPVGVTAVVGGTAVVGDMLVVVVVFAVDPPMSRMPSLLFPATSNAVTRIWRAPDVPGLNRTPDFDPEGSVTSCHSSEPTGRT